MNEPIIESGDDSIDVGPWSSVDSIQDELTASRQPVDYAQILGDNRALFLGDTHSNAPIRRHLIRHAEALKKAGITHYLIEAPDVVQPSLDRLNNGEDVDMSDLYLGPPYLVEGSSLYEEAIREMNAQGINVVAVDIDQTQKPDHEKREAHIAQRIQSILVDPDAKVAVLIGEFHMHKQGMQGIKGAANRIEDNGTSVIRVHFAGGTNRVPTIVTDATISAHMEAEEFMIDMRDAKGKYVPYKGSGLDYMIHLPHERQPRGLGILGDFEDLQINRINKVKGPRDLVEIIARRHKWNRSDDK